MIFNKKNYDDAVIEGLYLTILSRVNFNVFDTLPFYTFSFYFPNNYELRGKFTSKIVYNYQQYPILQDRTKLLENSTTLNYLQRSKDIFPFVGKQKDSVLVTEYSYFDNLNHIIRCQLLGELNDLSPELVIGNALTLKFVHHLKIRSRSKNDYRNLNNSINLSAYIFRNFEYAFNIKRDSDYVFDIALKEEKSSINSSKSSKSSNSFADDAVLDLNFYSVTNEFIYQQKDKELSDVNKVIEATHLLHLRHALGEDYCSQSDYLKEALEDPKNVYAYYYLKHLKYSFLYLVIDELITSENFDYTKFSEEYDSVFNQKYLMPEIKTKHFVRNPRALMLNKLFSTQELIDLNGEIVCSQAKNIFCNFSLIENNQIKTKMAMVVNRNGIIEAIDKEEKLLSLLTSIEPDYSKIIRRKKYFNKHRKIKIGKNSIIIDLNNNFITAGFVNPNLKSVANIDFSHAPSLSETKHAIRECFKQGYTSLRFTNDNSLSYASTSWLKDINKLRKSIPHIILGVNGNNIGGVDFYGEIYQKSHGVNFNQNLFFLDQLEKCGNTACIIHQHTDLNVLNLFLSDYYKRKSVKLFNKEFTFEQLGQKFRNLTSDPLPTEYRILSDYNSSYKRMYHDIFCDDYYDEDYFDISDDIRDDEFVDSGYFGTFSSHPAVTELMYSRYNFYPISNTLGIVNKLIRQNNQASKNSNLFASSSNGSSSPIPLLRNSRLAISADLKYFDSSCSIQWLKSCDIAYNLQTTNLPYIDRDTYYSFSDDELTNVKTLSNKCFLNFERLSGQDFQPKKLLDEELVEQLYRSNYNNSQGISYYLVNSNMAEHFEYLGNRIRTIRKYKHDLDFYLDFNIQNNNLPTVNVLEYLKGLNLPTLNLLQHLNKIPAQALDIDRAIGTLEVNKLANFIILNRKLDRINETWINGICVNCNPI
ncbi:hypothetical protein CKF54_03510 [Psittacicella hinzii]|uniref:Uncharacterized protein n=1 Tax=Psittacicella hinzii TaxID=2028575 RepID=A0A3A1Y787_9GAMM|nr:hypothetical protein [Psittacicella hinzii]RIY33129.1 hypothetical protein CKF54_03510 [Psittacicella hinzii]